MGTLHIHIQKGKKVKVKQKTEKGQIYFISKIWMESQFYKMGWKKEMNKCKRFVKFVHLASTNHVTVILSLLQSIEFKPPQKSVRGGGEPKGGK